MAADPSTRRASGVEQAVAVEAATTRDLYERYAGQILGYCLHQLGSREEAEDAVQSTFLNAFRGLKNGIVPESEAAWLFKIAQNVCLSRRRSTWRRGRIEAPTDFELVQELTPAPSRRGDELMGLQDVLEQMPESQRRAILLREWQGLSYREIAEELELSQGAVETLIFRARRSLAAGLEQAPGRKPSRMRRGELVGNAVAAVKSLLVAGSAATKVAATVAVVSGATVAVSAPVEQHVVRVHRAPPPLPAATHAATVPAAPAAKAPSAPAGTSGAAPAAERSGGAPPAAAAGEHGGRSTGHGSGAGSGPAAGGDRHSGSDARAQAGAPTRSSEDGHGGSAPGAGTRDNGSPRSAPAAAGSRGHERKAGRQSSGHGRGASAASDRSRGRGSSVARSRGEGSVGSRQITLPPPPAPVPAGDAPGAPDAQQSTSGGGGSGRSGSDGGHDGGGGGNG